MMGLKTRQQEYVTFQCTNLFVLLPEKYGPNFLRYWKCVLIMITTYYISLQILINSAKDLNIKYHPTGTNVTIEGPRFSTRAESRLYQSWGAHVINMTTVPEVIRTC